MSIDEAAVILADRLERPRPGERDARARPVTAGRRGWDREFQDALTAFTEGTARTCFKAIAKGAARFADAPVVLTGELGALLLDGEDVSRFTCYATEDPEDLPDGSLGGTREGPEHSGVCSAWFDIWHGGRIVRTDGTLHVFGFLTGTYSSDLRNQFGASVAYPMVNAVWVD